MTPLASSKSRCFINLPTELRLKVYEFLYQEINIHCSVQHDGFSRDYTTTVFPSPAVLHICRRIQHEAKSYFEKASITVTVDYQALIDPDNFPPHVLRRIHTLSHCDFGTPLFPTVDILSTWSTWFTFVDVNICPQLRLVRKLPHYKNTNISFPMKHGLLPILLPLLQQPQSSLATPSTALSTSLAKDYETEWRKSGLGDKFDDARTILIDHKLTVRTLYTFGIRMIDHGASIDHPWNGCILMEQWYSAELAWDGDRFLVEGLPDFQEEAWWKDPTGWTSYTRAKDGLCHLQIQVCEASQYRDLYREWQCWYERSW